MYARKQQYRAKAEIVWAILPALDRAVPSSMDDAAWEKYEAAVNAMCDFASHLQAYPYNPVLTEAKTRGDFADFAKQLRGPNKKSIRNVRGWTKNDVKHALPVIDKWAKESGQTTEEE